MKSSAWPEWLRRLPVCGRTGKKAHPDRGSALRHSKRLLRTAVIPGGTILSEYRCPACQQWHVGRLQERGGKG